MSCEPWRGRGRSSRHGGTGKGTSAPSGGGCLFPRGWALLENIHRDAGARVCAAGLVLSTRSPRCEADSSLGGTRHGAVSVPVAGLCGEVVCGAHFVAVFFPLFKAKTFFSMRINALLKQKTPSAPRHKLNFPKG